MKLLMHICCAPCAIFPLRKLRESSHEVMGFFYNNNIHPYTEYLRRQNTLVQYAEDINLKLILSERYDLEGFLRAVAFRESERCRHCYYDRLRTSALMAKRGKFEAFTSTLLYSKFQKHELIRSIGEAVGHEIGIPFWYEDFRPGWQEGIETSKTLAMYRQQYCGCIYSEKDRFYNPRRKQKGT